MTPGPRTARGATGIVLAGGRSARFGRPKLEADLDGRPLLDHVLERLRDVAVEVVLSLPWESGPNPPADVVAVRDPEAFGGPLVGLAAALAHASNELAIVVGGDMPRLRPAVLAAMLDALEAADGAGAVVLGAEGRRRPLPLAIRVEPAREAARDALAAGERSLRAFVARLEHVVVDEPDWRRLDPDAESLVDVDRPEDLEGLR